MLIKLAALLGHVLLGLLLAGILIWWLQPRMIFYPLKTVQSTPADWGMAFEHVQLTTEDGIALHGWLIPAARRRTEAPHTLLFFHGNAGNISHRRDSIAIFNALGLDVLIIDYRGFGQSEGSPSEQGPLSGCRRRLALADAGPWYRGRGHRHLWAILGWGRRDSTRGADAAGWADRRVQLR